MVTEKTDNDQFKEFAEKMLGAIESLSTRIETVETSVSSQSDSLASIQDSATPPPGGDTESNPSLAEMDLEGMSRKDFASIIAQTVLAEVQNKVVAPVSERVGNLATSAEEKDLRDEFNKVASANDDFSLYKAAMLEMVDSRPHLSVAEMFTLAKAENPEIATNAAEELAKDSPKAQPGFSGLTPTSGSTTENNGAASVNDAAEDAWNDTMTDQANVG